MAYEVLVLLKFSVAVTEDRLVPKMVDDALRNGQYELIEKVYLPKNRVSEYAQIDFRYLED
jgi:hypothetical protein